MPPKKPKTAGGGSSSQPIPSSNIPTRASGRKRRHSDASNVSQAASSSVAPTKKNKRAKSGNKQASRVILEEPEVDVPMNPASDETEVRCGETTEQADVRDNDDHAEDHIVFTHKEVHFASIPESAVEETSTATNITPHPRKMSIKRRMSLSPSVSVSHLSKRFKKTSARSSLPASLAPQSQDDERDTATIIQELQFAPLRSVLDERIRRRLRRSGLSEAQNALDDRDRRDLRALEQLEAKEAKLQELALELETQRQFAMDVSDETASEHEKVKEMEREIAALKQELVEYNAGLDREYMERRHTPDEDMLVLRSEKEVSCPQLPTPDDSQAPAQRELVIAGADAAGSASSSPIQGRPSLGTAVAWDVERRSFEDAIVALSREANDAKAELQILHIELGALGFANDGTSSRDVLKSIRESFARVREEFGETLPDTFEEGLSNSEVLDVLVANVQEFATSLRHQESELNERDNLVTDLTSQIQGLLDHLADAEIRKHILQTQWTALDQSNESKMREMEDLEEELEATQQERDDLQAQLDAHIEEVGTLGEENRNMVKSVAKLTSSLESYRKEEVRLSELIIKMETEHRNCITKMNQEREETVKDLDHRFDTESRLRGAAEEEAKQRQDMIATLAESSKGLTAERDGLLIDLKAMSDALGSERDRREDLEARLDTLEQELSDLNGEIEELRQHHEAERRQREQAETELDQLNEKLHQQGIEANQLRQKLFELQQSHEKKIVELQKNMSKRDEQSQADVAVEVSKREALEVYLQEVEDQMRADIAERDATIAELEKSLAESEDEVDSLKGDLERAEQAHDRSLKQHEERVDVLQGTIDNLKATVLEHEETIASLDAEVAGLETAVSDLQNEKSGLERRVEEEAEQMLQLQNDKQDEIDSLKQAIRDKQQKILIVEEKAVEADRSWQEVLDARNQEIADLHATAVETSTAKDTVTIEYASMKKRFQEYILRTSGAIDKLQAALLTAKTVVDDEGDQIKAEGEDLFQELRANNEIEQVVLQKTAATNMKTRSKKRYQDSGIGLDDEDTIAISG